MRIDSILASLLAVASVEARLGVSHAKARWLGLQSQMRGQAIAVRDIDPAKLYPAYYLSVPIDHFHNESKYEPHTNANFNLRYWFDASHYKAGGPVIVFESGESDASSRLPILQKGIIADLAQATNGVGVILEHRYYGKSQPFDDFSTEHLRFLTTDQALADTAFFAQNVVFKGLEQTNLTSYAAPWVAYGGSYSGVFVAFLRKLYPETFWAAISSSGVTEAIIDYWAYYEPVRKYGPATCVKNLQHLVNVMDNILLNNTSYAPTLKNAFGMGSLTHADDFMNILGDAGIGYWQDLNWDPSVSYNGALDFCKTISNQTLQYTKQRNQSSIVKTLLKAGGYESMTANLTVPLLNWIGWVQGQVVKPCADSNKTLDQCYGTHGPTHYQSISLHAYRNWPYQVCTQWGYYLTGSGVPADQLPLISRLLTVPYSSIVCKQAFNVTTPPDVKLTNQWGGYNISYPRLALIDGQWDPWREATPHADVAPKRTSTASEPYYEIDKSVHHWDENGVFQNQTTADFPPPRIQKIQKLEVQWVKQWLQEAKGYFPVAKTGSK